MRKKRMTIGLVIVLLAASATAASALETWWIPAAASNPGLHGTSWTTDLWLHSRVNDADITVTATFFTGQAGTTEPAEATIELPPSATVEIPDAVATLFGEHRPGSIRLEAEYPFFAASRTFNSGGAAGTFGQGIPAYPSDTFVTGYTLLGASHRSGPDGIRTNLGIANVGPGTATLNVFVRDPETLDLLGTAAVEVGPYGWFQADVFELVGAADREVSIADVSVWPSGGQLVYLSRVDNRSGDGTFVFGSSGDSIAIAGNPQREHEVRTTLTYDDGVTVDWLKWKGPDGDWVYTEQPSSGFVTDAVNQRAPFEYCIDVVGRSAPAPAVTGVTVSIQTRQPGGEWSGDSTSFSTAGNSPIDQEFCKDVE